MKFDFVTTTSNNYAIMGGATIIGVFAAAAVLFVLSEVLEANKIKSIFVGFSTLLTILFVGFWLSSTHQISYTNQDQSLSQVEEQGVTIMGTGSYLFYPVSGSVLSGGWASIDSEQYIQDHLLQLKGDDGTNYSCRVTVPKINDDDLFFVDCLQPNSDNQEYVPLDEVLKAS